MANKLTDLTVEKIAFVDEGDNPEADILLFKRKPEEASLPDTGSEESILKRLAAAIAKTLGMTGDEKDTQDDTSESGSDSDSGESEADKCGKKKEPAETQEKKEGDFMDMSRIDKSKLTPEELAQLAAIEKKALIEEPAGGAAEPVNNNPEPVSKGAEETEDIYKGIHPAVKEELENLKKFRAEAEEKELLAVAKKYEIIGKKPEELVNTFKSLKAAGGSAYDEMIAVLDESVNMVKNAGVFDEIGKRGEITGGGAEKAWAQIENHAKEIQKAKPDISWEQAVDTAALQHPELVQEYENNI